MKKYTLISITLLLFYSCCGNYQRKEQQPVSDTRDSIQAEQVAKPTKRTINIREYGQQILDKAIKPSDNEETFACLDSLDDPNPDTRAYFFTVYLSIAQQSDGALSEVIGSYLKVYLQHFPMEAIQHFKAFSTEEKERFMKSLAYEFYAASGPDFKKDIDRYFSVIGSNCTTCSEEQISLDKIQNELFLLVVDLNKE